MTLAAAAMASVDCTGSPAPVSATTGEKVLLTTIAVTGAAGKLRHVGLRFGDARAQ
jgi:hypothetical protein